MLQLLNELATVICIKGTIQRPHAIDSSREELYIQIYIRACAEPVGWYL